MNVVKKFKKGKILIPFLGGRYLKIFLPHCADSLTYEFQASEMALNDPIWGPYALPVKRIPFGLIMTRGQKTPKTPEYRDKSL